MRIRSVLPTLALLSLLAASATSGRVPGYEIDLASRRFTPSERILEKETDGHAVVQFHRIPTAAERQELERRGIRLLEYVPNYAWTASVRGGATTTLDRSLVRSVFELLPGDKVAARATDRKIVRAFVYGDVEDGASVVARHGTILEEDRESFTLELGTSAHALAAEDAVRYVDIARPAIEANNDVMRANIHANEVQAAPYGLSGQGLPLGIWDQGNVSADHDDFSGRLTIADPSFTNYHATLVAGIMAGDGTRSIFYGGEPLQWRGVATEADIFSYDWPVNVWDMDEELGHAIDNYSIILSQNSWGWDLCSDNCGYFGVYDDWSQNYDKIVSGSLGKKVSVIFSAGNEGNCGACAWALDDYPYGTVTGPGATAKNTIAVASHEGDTDDLSGFSSRGPTADGRIKPELSGPGCKDSGGITSTYTNNDYNSMFCGTSFSAPAVSGCAAIIQEDFLDKFGREAWPSTVKALLIEGARDLGYPGPDYSYGFGGLDIQSSIDIIREDDGAGDLIKEGTITTGEVFEAQLIVEEESQLKITLAWDDYFGSYTGVGKRLVNDLDLEVVSPSRAVYYPWTLTPSVPWSFANKGVDDVNNVEQLEVSAAEIGTWTVRVRATFLPEPDQDFSLVTNISGIPDAPPAPPTGVGAVPGPGEGEISVSWDANAEPDFHHYRLERSTSASFGPGTSSFTGIHTTFLDSDLLPGETYYYRVFAVDDGAHESGPSGTVSTEALDLVPAPPTGLGALSGPGDGEISLLWDPNSEPDVDHYRVERDTTALFGGGTFSFTTSETSAVDAGLTTGRAYYYRVFAVDNGGNEGEPSNTASAYAIDGAPAPPTGLMAVPGPSEGEISVSWNASTESDLSHYRVERDTTPAFGPGTVSTVTSDTSHVDSGLVMGQVYYYRAFASDTAGHESGPSATVSAAAEDVGPSAPTGLGAVPGPADGELTLSWDANPEPDIDHYRLERDTTPAFAAPVSLTTASTVLVDSGLTPGVTYYYRAFAVDTGDNESGPSGTVSAVPQNLGPMPPTNVVAVPGAMSGQIQISWDAGAEPDIDHYRVERATSDAFGPGTVSFVASFTSFLDSGLVAGDMYYYRVFAVDNGGEEGAPSEVASATAQDFAPDTPADFDASAGPGDGEVTASWRANTESDIAHYRLQRHVSPSFGPGAVEFTTTDTVHVDTGLSSGTVYYYRAFAVDVYGYESSPTRAKWAIAQNLPPVAPTGLAAAPGPDAGEISVSWDASGELDFDHYRLERDTTPAFGAGTVSLTTRGTTHDDSGLVPGGTYYYRVFAVDSASNESDPSATASADARDTAPEAPTGLFAVPGSGDGEIDISWDANPEPDIDHYRLERDTAPSFGPGTASFTTPGTTYEDAGLVPGDTYYYRVFAIDAEGNESPPSDTAWSQAADSGPAAPTGLVAAPGPAEGEIAVSWDASGEPDLDHYRLERDATAGFGPGTVSFTTTSTTHDDAGLVPGATYYYRAFVVDTDGNESAPSATASAEATDLPPAAPTGLAAAPGAADGEIAVSWDANGEPDLDHYRLERDTTPAFGPGTVSLGTASTTHDDAGLTPGATYYYRVFAADAGGSESDPSGTDSAVATDLPPAAPTGLDAVSGPGDGEISISWDANGEADLDHYRLERDTTPAFGPGSVSFTATGTSHVDPGLVLGAVYYYRVFAVDATGNESAASDTASATALDVAPAAPTGLAAVPGPAEGEISVSWDPNGEPDLDHYRLERDTTPAFGAGTVSLTTTGTTHVDSGLVVGATYYYRAFAVDAGANESEPSGTASAPAQNDPPAVPTGLAAVPGPAEGEISVSWDANGEPDFDHYRLERDTTPVFGAGTISLTTTSTTHDDTGLVPGTTYYYRVLAVDAGGNESDPSGTTSAAATDLAPAAPTGLDAVPGPGDGDISLSWNANGESDLDHYRIERDTTPAFGAGTVSFTAGGTSHVDSGLTPGETYYYRAFAVDATGNESAASDTASATALDAAPASPTGLAAVAGPGADEVSVSWDANGEPDFDHYRLERDTTPAFGAGTVSHTTTGTTHVDSGLVPGTTYYYRVFAIDAGGNESGPSGTVSASPPSQGPLPPTNVTAAPAFRRGGILIDWDASSDPEVDHYRLERGTSPAFGPGSVSFTAGYTSFLDRDLVPGDVYYYRVFSVNGEGEEGAPSATVWSMAQDFEPSAPTGLAAVAGPGDGQITTTWNANPEPDVDHYLLERHTSPYFGPGSFTFTAPETTYVDSGLASGVAYYYRVFAVDTDGYESGASGTAWAIAQETPLSPPTGLSAVPGSGEGEISVSWDASGEPLVDHYRLERSTSASFSVGTSSFTTSFTLFLDSGLTPGTTYYYRVFAVAATGGESPPSATGSAEATDLPPDAPTGLVALAGPTDGEISLAWNANTEPDIDHYRVERAVTVAFGPGTVSFTSGTTSTVDSGLPMGGAFYYRVFAVDDGGNESGPSNVASAYPLDLAPAPPAGLTALSGPAEGEISVSWFANVEPDIDHYRLERDTTPAFGPGTVSIETAGTSHVDSGLVMGATYYYRVFAVDATAHESGPSTTASASAQDIGPSPPTGLDAVSGPAEGEISLTWNPNGEPDLDHYRLERDTTPAFGPGTVSFTTSATAYVDSGLTPGDTYYYRLFAVDAEDNESGPSAIASADAADLAPAAPTGVAAEPGAGEGEVSVSWNANGEPDLDHYRLERDTTPAFGSATVSFEVGVTSLLDSGLVSGQTYYYRVFAIDAGGNESGPSNVVSAVATDTPPSAPTGLAAVSGPLEGEISLSWNLSGEPDFDHYRLERDTTPAFGPGTVSTTTSATSHVDSGLTPGDTFYYRVFAVDVGGNESALSGAVSGVALVVGPLPPTNVVAVPGFRMGRIQISWDMSEEPDLDHYRLERDTSPLFGPGTVSFVAGFTAFLDRDLVPGDVYYYRVFSIDGSGEEGSPSNTASGMAQDFAPDPPTGLAAAAGPGGGEVTVTWNPNAEVDIDHYRLQRYISPSFGPGSAEFTTSETTYLDSGLTPGTVYYYRLFAVDESGYESNASGIVWAIPQGGLRSTPSADGASLSLLGPNPFGAEIRLAYTVPSSGADVTLAVYDITGRLTRVLVDRHVGGGSREVRWDGNNENGRAVPSGVYFCRISIGEWTGARKIVRIR